jgi:uncharacterized membrane protein
MRTEEFLIILVVAFAVLVVPLAALTLAIVAFVRSRRVKELSERVVELEQRLEKFQSAPRAAYTQRIAELEDQTPDEEPLAEQVDSAAWETGAVDSVEILPSPVTSKSLAEPSAPHQPHSVVETNPVGWETFIGQKAFGWMAVVLFIFATAFFLRYAYQNDWIGPVGRVAIGEFVGLALIVGGWRYWRQNWHRFSTMLTSTGVVVLYLATYASFGFYELLSQQATGLFLTLLVVESMIVAACYRSAAVAMVSVIGGLLTPILMASSHDTYQSFFTYLAVLNLATLLADYRSRWVAVASTVFVGIQLLFWSWYHVNFHPDKRAWALGFQMAIFAMHLFSVSGRATRQSPSAIPWVAEKWMGWEDAARMVSNAVAGFVAFRALTLDILPEWMGTASLVTATIYMAVGLFVLKRKPGDQRLLLTTLAIAVGFIAWAFPVQCNARWVSLGWAAMGSALWWFGLRVSSGGLRLMATVMGVLSVGRLLIFELPIYIREPFIPVFNQQAFPSICVAACVLASVLVSNRFRQRRSKNEINAVGVAAAVGMLLLWLLLSMECYGWFVSRSMYGGDVGLWRWRGQLALSVFWTAFASLILMLGFRFKRKRLRWMGMVLFGVTVVKLFVVDMANVQQLYRILAFFVLAIVLGLVARAYQKFRQDGRS